MPSLKETLTRKAGPLPVWAWGVAGAGAIGVAVYIRRQQAAEAPSVSPPSLPELPATPAPTPTYPYADVIELPSIELIPPPAVELPALDEQFAASFQQFTEQLTEAIQGAQVTPDCPKGYVWDPEKNKCRKKKKGGKKDGKDGTRGPRRESSVRSGGGIRQPSVRKSTVAPVSVNASRSLVSPKTTAAVRVPQVARSIIRPRATSVTRAVTVAPTARSRRDLQTQRTALLAGLGRR